MIYQGSKRRLAKHIIPFLEKALKHIDAEAYVEPFCGGANLITKIQWKKRVGFDIESDIIALLKYMQTDGEIKPLFFTKKEYRALRQEVLNGKKDKFQNWEYGYISVVNSFRGIVWGGGYGEPTPTEQDKTFKYMLVRHNNILKQRQEPNFKDIIFHNLDYKVISLKNCVFYLDPPYEETKSLYAKNYSLKELLEWVETQKEDNVIFLSEYKNPDETKWKEIWHKTTIDGMFTNSKQPKTERLFIYMNEKTKRFKFLIFLSFFCWNVKQLCYTYYI